MKPQLSRKVGLIAFSLLLVLLLAGCSVSSQSTGQGFNMQFGAPGGDSEMAQGLQIIMLLTGLTLIPVLLMLMTGFVRIVIVLSMMRNALGTAQLPPNQVIVGMALVLTFFVMNPVWTQINDQALQPFIQGQITQATAMDRGIAPLRNFMFKQVREEDLGLFIDMANLPRPDTQADVPTYVLAPAFVISELRTAFQMAFVIYVPFLVIDMVVSSALMSMGMMMLPPTVVSLPFKLLLFVLVDGWHLIVQSLVQSFH